MEATDLITIPEAAILRGVTPQAIHDLIRRKRLPFVVKFEKRVVSRADVLSFVPQMGKELNPKPKRKRRKANGK